MIISVSQQNYSISNVGKWLEGVKLEVKPGLGGPLFISEETKSEPRQQQE